MGEEEPISFHEPLKLCSNEAGECGTNKAVSVSWLLGEPATEPVNLIDIGIDCRQVGPVLGVYLRRWISHRGKWIKSTEGPQAVVGRDSMITTSLDVSSRQIVTKSSRTKACLTEQEVLHIRDHRSVSRWAQLLGGSLHLVIPVSSRLIVSKDKVVILKPMKFERPSAIAIEEAGDEGVAKAEGNR